MENIELKNQNELLHEQNCETSEFLKNETKLGETSFSPFCQKNCKTCFSPHLEEIHKLRLEQDMTLRDISEFLKVHYNENIHASALHRHFANYHQNMKIAVEKKMLVYLKEEVDQRGSHTAKLTTLINGMFDKIAIDWQKISPSIQDLERLMKLRYLVMEGKISLGDYDEQLKIIIQNADKIQNNNLQTSLFFPASPPELKVEEPANK